MNKFIIVAAVVLTAVVLVRRQRSRRLLEGAVEEKAVTKGDAVAVARLEDEGGPVAAVAE